MRMRRKVVEHPLGFSITDDQFVTTDRCLAEHVAAEMDRIDPLPCAGHEWVEITELGDREPRFLCRHCGDMCWESERV